MTTALKIDVKNDLPPSPVSNEASEGELPCGGTLGCENETIVCLAMS